MGPKRAGLPSVPVLSALLALSLAPPAEAQWDGTAPPGPKVIAAVQARLSELGHYRGRADGLVGQMTREAIRRYQMQVGMEPTGALSLAIYRKLRGIVDADDPGDDRREVVPSIRTAAAAGLPPDAGPNARAPANGHPQRSDAALAGTAPDAVTVSGSTWRFLDRDGAGFTVTFRPDGVVDSLPFSDSWGWVQSGDGIELRYANRLGRTATRRGALVTEAEMAGSGRSSRGAEWSWSATRVR